MSNGAFMMRPILTAGPASRLRAHHDALAFPAQRDLRLVSIEVGRDPMVGIVLRKAVVVRAVDIDEPLRTDAAGQRWRDRKIQALEMPARIELHLRAFVRVGRVEVPVRATRGLDAKE